MKAITVRQPWASLIVAGTKTIETRPAPPNGSMRPDGVRGLPGLPIEPGERIAIHASAAKPKIWWEPVWSAYESQHRPPEGHWLNLPGADAFDDGYESADGDWWHHAFSGPLGAIIGYVTVAEALPVELNRTIGDWDDPWRRILCVDGRTMFLAEVSYRSAWVKSENVPECLNAQLPLGEFGPGRWGWMLSDPEACTPRPMKGRQGVWEVPA